MGNCWPIFRIMGIRLPIFGIMGIRLPIVRITDNCWPIFRIMGNCWLSPIDCIYPSPLMDAIETIREIYEKIDPIEQIDPLISFIKYQLHKMNTPSEAESSSSEGWLATVRDSTKLAEEVIDTISSEAEKLSNSEDAMEVIGSLMLEVLEGIGVMHWVLIGLSMAAFTLDSFHKVGCTDNKCRELLLKIIELAKDFKEYNQQTPNGREKLRNAVVTIVQGAFICCDYLKNGNRFWSATIAASQLEKINQQLGALRDFLALCSLQRHWDKDVFLSHSGKQKNFVRQLYRDLKKEHVSCFFDEDHNSLPLAERFPPLIFKAAETCKIAVLVLSKEFIRSKWPMLELAAFISAKNSGKNVNLKILPIFFMITPKELSYTKDSPEWKRLEKNNKTRREWQDALKLVRSINGLPFGENGNEVHLRDEVVKKVSDLLKQINPEPPQQRIKRDPPQLLDFEPVGIEEQVRELKVRLDMEGAQPALAVIVCGFGGMGKTTLAASVVQSLDWSSSDYIFCSIVIDDKPQDKTFHIIKLQKYIIKTIGGRKLDFQNPAVGRHQIKEAFKNKSSLLFIDNVVDKDYIQDLLPQELQFCDQETKLRIIITSRDKNVKAKLNIMCVEYDVKGLSDADSKRLLLKTIVQSQVVENIDLDEKRMINDVAAACRGVPLLLSVFGQHLRTERNKESYEEALNVLREGNLDSYRDEDLGSKLMFVYSKIKDVEVKEAFLDICTYFHGWKWSLVADIVDYPKLEDLRRRMLVSKSGLDKVIVHEILRLMGMKEAGPTRFSNWEKLSDAFEYNLDGLSNVKGISHVSDFNNNRLITIPSRQLEVMHQSLRVLMLGDWVTLDGPCHRAFRNVRYLSVGDITLFPFKDLSKLDKLKVFVNRSKPGMNLPHLPSSLKRISHEVPFVECDEFAKLPFQNLSSLKSFIVKTQKSVELPHEFQLPASLVDLDLSRCKNLPKCIGHLTALESLSLNGSDLNSLPQGFGKLKKLKHFEMDYCSKLGFLPEEFGDVCSLESLRMNGCRMLRGLPERLGELLSLQILELSGSINLQLLPESFGELPISSLNLDSLVNLQKLPNSFGKMPLLKFLKLKSCHSLTSFPDSFVKLKMLNSLIISNCTKFSILPYDFGRLKYLNYMTVEYCQLLKELPRGFGALSALKTFTLRCCNSFVNLPDFAELTSLEELRLESLPLISRIPDGLGKLKRLRFLSLVECFLLKTLSDDFENMANLERLVIRECMELEGTMMEKILKLQNCSMADIESSTKLSEKWKQMQSEIEHPIAVFSGDKQIDREVEERTLKVALLNGKCVEMNHTSGQLMERSSLLVGLEEGTRATVALIMLPNQMQSYQHQKLERFVEMAREREKTYGSGMLQIVCGREYAWTDQRPTPREEEEEGIRQILLPLPKGSCVLSKRVNVPTKYSDWYHFSREPKFFIGHVVVDMEGRKSFENFEVVELGNVVTEPPPSEICKREKKQYNTIQNFIESICYRQSQFPSVAGQSKTREFMETLKDNGIDHLLVEGHKLMVDDLHGKTIGFIICNFKVFECIKLQQIFKDIQQKDSDFLVIRIPEILSLGFKDVCGHGSHTRSSQSRPWATFPHQMDICVLGHSFALLDKEGNIAIKNVYLAWELLVGWGAKLYPFTQHSTRESFSLIKAESCFEFLLHGMNIVGRKPMESKMTYLYAKYPSEYQNMTFKLQELTHIHGNFEVLYVGSFHEWEISDIENRMQLYGDAIQDMRWPSLSFSDMIMFRYRCKFLASTEGYELYKESNIMMETVHGLGKHLVEADTSLVLADNNGVVTLHGMDVVEMICDSFDASDGVGMAMRRVKDELVKSLSRGECSPLVKTLFIDDIDSHPFHPQHRLYRWPWKSAWEDDKMCNVCFRGISGDWSGKLLYKCVECWDDWPWYMCGYCWMAYAIQQVEQPVHAKDN